MSLVLCIGVDPVLIESRKLILEAGGHTVITATHDRAVVEACGKYCFDVAVLGQAISPEEKRHIAADIRKHCPRAKILELYAVHEGRCVRADSWLEVPTANPNDLAKRVSELAQNEKGVCQFEKNA